MLDKQDDIEKEIILAKEAFKKKEYLESASILKRLVETNPDSGQAHRELGLLLSHSPSQEKAHMHLKKATELGSNDINNWMALSFFYKNNSMWNDALSAFMKLSEFPQKKIFAYEEIFEIHRDLDSYDHAITMIKNLLQVDPTSILYLREYGKLLIKKEQYNDAIEVYDRLVERTDEMLVPADAISEWLELLTDHGSSDTDMRQRIVELHRSNPKDPMFLLLYAKVEINKLNIEKALRLLEEVYIKAPENIVILKKLAATYMEMGQYDKTEKLIKEILLIDPNDFEALIMAPQNHKYSYGDSHFEQLNFLAINEANLETENRIKLHYILGKAYDDVGELGTAFEHYRVGGLMHSEGKHHSHYFAFKNFVTSMKNEFTHSETTQSISGYRSDKPVFIVGMPRSGTSLIEQVLSSIDEVYGAGELHYVGFVTNRIKVGNYQHTLFKSESSFGSQEKITLEERGQKYVEMIDRLAPEGSTRIIDKMPENFKSLGLIHMILPDAKFIHSRRHPVETCLSAYRLLFTEGLYWSDDLQTIGKYYRLYTEMMEYWKSVLPKETIIEVRYEDMVNDLEYQSKRLAKHIGVAWSPNCLEFHKSDRAVRTASLSQVRQPIYKTSINRWSKYEPYLQPLLDEIGDLVEAYESELADSY